MIEEQDNKCAICGQEETAKNNGIDVNKLAVDHDHVTGRVRGLLCKACNNGLGHFQDDPELLEAAIRYLKEHGR